MNAKSCIPGNAEKRYFSREEGVKDLESVETCCWWLKRRLVDGCWAEEKALAHIHVGFFKGGKPGVSAGGEDAFKPRTAIRNRNHWRWRLRIRYRRTSIRKSATPTHTTTTTTTATTSKTTLPGDVGTHLFVARCVVECQPNPSPLLQLPFLFKSST